jgi:hypothetical protein
MTTAHSNKISGITTNTFELSEVVNKQYVDQVVPLPDVSGNSGKFLYSTDGISQSWDYISNTQEFSSVGEQTFTFYSGSNILFIEIMGGGGGGGAGASNGTSGHGGGSASYTSWYIPTNLINSDLTVIVGSGGTGGISDGQSGSAGFASTVTFTSDNNVGVVTLTSLGGGSSGTAASSQGFQTGRYYTTVGLAGASGRATDGTGNAATTQNNLFQPTGGGGGARSTAATSLTGGSGGSISLYGNTIQSTGGSGNTNGTSSTSIDGIVYGHGGGGGGAANASGAGSGGQGIRGSGGGGGGCTSSGFGTGGNGGNGFVRVTWF